VSSPIDRDVRWRARLDRSGLKLETLRLGVSSLRVLTQVPHLIGWRTPHKVWMDAVPSQRSRDLEGSPRRTPLNPWHKINRRSRSQPNRVTSREVVLAS